MKGTPALRSAVQDVIDRLDTAVETLLSEVAASQEFATDFAVIRTRLVALRDEPTILHLNGAA